MNIFEKYPSSEFLRELCDGSDPFSLRERIIELFGYLDGLEDPHFERELDRDPYSRLWEMMLAKILKVEGHEPTSGDSGPDFVVEMPSRRVFIEAIAPGPGDEANPNSVAPIRYDALMAQDIPIAQIVLRVRSALEEKRRKYVQYLAQGIVSEGDICIIAVNSAKIGPGRASGLWPPVIMQATHGLGSPYATFSQEEGFVDEGIESRTSIPKINGPNIDTIFLLSEANSLVSGVLYSDCSFFSGDFDLFGASIFLHNPKASVPVSVGFTKRMREIWTVCCEGGSGWRAYRVDDAW